MKLRDTKSSKDYIFDECYSRIIDDFEVYYDISKKEMIESIIEVYSNGCNICDLCTIRELEVLKKISYSVLTISDKKEFVWELKALKRKLIIDSKNLIYDELKEYILQALELVNYKDKETKEKIQIGIIGLVKSYVVAHIIDIKEIISEIYDISEKEFDKIFKTPLVRFYVFQWTEELFDDGDYTNYIDEIIYKQNQYRIIMRHQFTKNELENIFYYGYNISNGKIKKMYDIIIQNKKREKLNRLIDDIRVFNYDIEYLIKYISENYEKEAPKIIQVLERALLEIPRASLQSLTPMEWQKNQEKIKAIHEEFKSEIQKNACISKKHAKLFYKILIPILNYVNKKYKIFKFKIIKKRADLNPYQTGVLITKLWENREEVLNQFVRINPANLTKSELKLVNGFKTAKYTNYLVVKFTKEYTEFLSKDGKIYMVKGINYNIDKILSPESTPYFVKTALLEFNGELIYDSFLPAQSFKKANELMETWTNMYSKSEKAYHLEKVGD